MFETLSIGLQKIVFEAVKCLCFAASFFMRVFSFGVVKIVSAIMCDVSQGLTSAERAKEVFRT